MFFFLMLTILALMGSEFGDNEALQEKLELLNTMMLHQDPFQLQDPHQRRLNTMHPTHCK